MTIKTKTRGPIRWFGGKGRMRKNILPLLPKCHTYVEVFGGGAALLFAREPSQLEVYNDVDDGLVDFFRVLSDANLFKKFYRRVACLPYSRGLFYECRETWHTYDDIIERVWRWFVVARQSFGGHFANSWGFTVASNEEVLKWLSVLSDLPAFHARLQRVQIEKLDFRKCLETYDTTDTLFYVDPPYVHSVRKKKRYQHELTDDDHRELVDRLLGLKGMVALSGYAHPIYEKLEKNGWDRRDFKTACHAAGRTRATGILGAGSAMEKQPRIESLWRNPACIQAKGQNGRTSYLSFE